MRIGRNYAWVSRLQYRKPFHHALRRITAVFRPTGRMFSFLSIRSKSLNFELKALALTGALARTERFNATDKLIVVDFLKEVPRRTGTYSGLTIIFNLLLQSQALSSERQRRC